MPLPDPFDAVAVPRDLVSQFIAVFSRCEFAMKETSYRREDNGMAAAAWQKLASEAAGWLVVDSGSALEHAIDDLSQNPPKVQTFAHGWQPRQLRGATKVAQAIEAAVRVHHSLFHGSQHEPGSAPGRDLELVQSALTLLLAVVEQAPGDLPSVYSDGPRGA